MSGAGPFGSLPSDAEEEWDDFLFADDEALYSQLVDDATANDNANATDDDDWDNSGGVPEVDHGEDDREQMVRLMTRAREAAAIAATRAPSEQVDDDLDDDDDDDGGVVDDDDDAVFDDVDIGSGASISDYQSSDA